VQFGLLGRYDYYLLETDSFLQEAAALPWVTVPMGTVGRAEVLYRMRWRNFYQQPYSDLNNGLNQAAGFRQYFYVGAPDRYLWVSYIFDHERALTLKAGSRLQRPHWRGRHRLAISGRDHREASFSYTHEDYAPESNGRQDDEYQLTLVIRKPLTEYLALMAGYFGTINNSTDNAFEYDRHIGRWRWRWDSEMAGTSRQNTTAPSAATVVCRCGRRGTRRRGNAATAGGSVRKRTRSPRPRRCSGAHVLGPGARRRGAAGRRGRRTRRSSRDRSAGTWTTANIGLPVEVGDTLRTGRPGRLRVVFADESVTVLGDDSQLVIDDHVFAPDRGVFRSVLRMISGRVRTLASDYYQRPVPSIRSRR